MDWAESVYITNYNHSATKIAISTCPMDKIQFPWTYKYMIVEFTEKITPESLPFLSLLIRDSK